MIMPLESLYETWTSRYVIEYASDQDSLVNIIRRCGDTISDVPMTETSPQLPCVATCQHKEAFFTSQRETKRT